MNDPDYRGVKYEEFRDTEKAMTKPEYPQAGPPYDKTTYIGRLKGKVAAADDELGRASREFRSVLDEAIDTAHAWYTLVNDAISMLDRGVSGFAVKKHLIDVRREYIKGG